MADMLMSKISRWVPRGGGVVQGEEVAACAWTGKGVAAPRKEVSQTLLMNEHNK